MNQVTGVVVGLVKEIDALEGKVKLEFPWFDDALRSSWAPIASLMSGKERGAAYMPEVDDEALVAFEHGNFDHPFVIGFLWNGTDKSPTNDPNLRLIRSVNGHEIALYDPPVSGGDRGYIRVKDAHGNMIELTNGRITLRSVGAIDIQAPSVTINGRPVAPVGPPI